MMFKEEYKKAYDEIKVADGKVTEILKQAKCRNLPKQQNTMWKNVVATMLLAITLIVGINIPAFAQEIERVSRILNTGAVDYTYYKSLQRENPEWTQNAFVPNHAIVKKDGIIMKVELVTFYRKKVEAIISFANDEGSNWIHKDGDYNYNNISVKIGDSIPSYPNIKFIKYDSEKEKIYYSYTANRSTKQIPESETICIEVHGFFEGKSWEESIDLSNVASNANTRSVTLYNSNVNETLVSLKNYEYPYKASVLNITPLSEIKTDQVTVTGQAYSDGILRIQTCQPDNGVYNMNYVFAYIHTPLEKAEQLIWYEKIDGQLMLFIEDYYTISEESLNSLPMVMKFNEKKGAWNTTWSVAFEVEIN